MAESKPKEKKKVMTTFEILTAFIGFLICAFVVSLIGLVIVGIIWHLFVASMNSDIESEKKEDNQE